MKELFAVILAAGKGKRMKSELPKVLFRIDGVSLVEYVVKAVLPLGAKRIIVVVGYKAELVQDELSKYNLHFALQKEQLGTAHALKVALNCIDNTKSDLVVLCGDVPFISTKTLQNMLEHHRDANAHLTILAGITDNPSGYGRIVRDGMGNVVRIVEEKDATTQERLIKEFNSGIYVFDCEKVVENIDLVNNENAQKEFYLTDLVGIFIERGLNVSTYQLDDPFEVLGINSQEELVEREKEYLRRKYAKA